MIIQLNGLTVLVFSIRNIRIFNLVFKFKLDFIISNLTCFSFCFQICLQLSIRSTSSFNLSIKVSFFCQMRNVLMFFQESLSVYPFFRRKTFNRRNFINKGKFLFIVICRMLSRTVQVQLIRCCTNINLIPLRHHDKVLSSTLCGCA